MAVRVRPRVSEDGGRGRRGMGEWGAKRTTLPHQFLSEPQSPVCSHDTETGYVPMW